MTETTPTDAHALALNALAATLSDERRAQRFLSLTGLSPDGIRSGLGDPAVLAACLDFLEAHEPDLEDVAATLECRPADLVAARRELER